MNIAISKNKIPIRFTDERWKHITLGHPEMADYYYEIIETIELPDKIYEGNYDELIAIKYFEKLNDKFVVVIYKEFNNDDGFVITSYISNKVNELLKRKLLWEFQK
ncbi:MAG: hypothetical protein WCO54_06765 [Bacteroidota bacterium]